MKALSALVLRRTALYQALAVVFLWIATALGAHAASTVLGDLDGDGQITIFDVELLVNQLNGTAPLRAALLPFADINGDGIVDQTDLSGLVNLLLGIAPPARPATLEPGNGSTQVGVTVRPKVTFPRQINVATLNSNNFYASFAGQKLPATIVPSSDGTFAWLFLNPSMPNSAQITVTVDGSTITNLIGGQMDAAGTAVPGTAIQFNFSTVSVAPLANTSFAGRIVDPGPDLIPNTADDFIPNPDGDPLGGFYLLPIQGVKIYILGIETNIVYTDANGLFSLSPAPVGDVKVVVDGTTATHPPAAYYFPQMTVDTVAYPGQANNVMPGNNNTMYLPRVATGILHTVSASSNTLITLSSNGAYTLPTNQQQYLTINIGSNSLIGMDGQPMSSAQIGISVVPPTIVQDMLPPGLLQHTFDITIQALGVATFTTPATMTFPNVFNAPPGTKLNFLSFDHTTGRLVIDGTATVSADGLYVTTDPGTGVTHPGWHGLTPPGNTLNGLPGVPCPNTAAVQAGLNAASTMLNSLWNSVKAVAGIASVLDAKAPILSLLKGFGITLNAIDCYQSTGWQQVGACSSLTLNIALLFNPAGEIKLLAQSVSIGVSIYKAYSQFQSVGQQINQAAQTPPCNTSDGQGLIRRFKARSLGQDDAVAASQTVSNMVGKVSGQLLILTNMLDDAQVIFNLTAEADANQAQLGLTVSQFIQLTNTMTDYLNLYNQLTNQGFFLDDALNLIEMLPSIISAYTVPVMPPQYSVGVAAGKARVKIQDKIEQDAISQARTSPIYWSAEYSNTVIRGTAPPGQPANLFVPPDTVVLLRYFDPVLNQIGLTVVLGGPSGTPLNANIAPMLQDTGVDTDGDGLSDEAELIIGSDPSRWSTCGDDISDGERVAQGLDFTHCGILPTGLVGSLPLTGTTKAITIAGLTTTNSAQLTAYVACGSGGLSIVNLAQFENPVLLGQLALPGDATGVAIDPTSQIALVAAGIGGLHFVDISNPMQPAVLRTTLRNVSQVAIVAGVAYALEPNAIDSFDIIAGQNLQRLSSPGGSFTGLADDGLFLYTMDSVNRLRIFDLSTGVIVARGHVTLPNGGGQLIVGDGIAYVAANNYAYGGFLTVDVTDPDNPTLIANTSATSSSASGNPNLTVNGSGLALVLSQAGRGAIDSLQVFDISNPANTGAFQTTFRLPADPYAVTVGAGIAFVADGTAGLQVVSYKGLDTLGVPPNITLSNSFSMIDATNGTADESSLVQSTALVHDDVQVRNVEFYIDGSLVVSDQQFPFECVFATPSISGTKTNFTLQARAFDTGGNATWSSLIQVALATNLSPPVVRDVWPSRNTTMGADGLVAAYFNKPMDPTTLNSTTFQLSWFGQTNNTNGVITVPVTNGIISWRSDLNASFMSFQTNLAPGLYLAVMGTGVKDLQDISLAESVSWYFYVLGSVDSDQDGIPDDIEIQLGLNPTNSSTFNDGILDGNRILDGYADPKYGGLTAAWKLRYGYNPSKSDSFDDGIPDAERDPDFDGLNNAAEQYYGTNPFNADTDGDGWDDQTEILSGTDPLDPNSRPIIKGYAEADAVSYLNAQTLQPPANTTWLISSAPVSLLNALSVAPPSNTIWSVSSLTASYLNALPATPPTNTVWTISSAPASYLNALPLVAPANVFLVSPVVSYENNH